MEAHIPVRKPTEGLPRTEQKRFPDSQVYLAPLGADSILMSRAGEKDQKEKVRNGEAFGRVLGLLRTWDTNSLWFQGPGLHLITNLKRARSRTVYASLLYTSFVLINHNVFSKFG